MKKEISEQYKKVNVRKKLLSLSEDIFICSSFINLFEASINYFENLERRDVHSILKVLKQKLNKMKCEIGDVRIKLFGINE